MRLPRPKFRLVPALVTLLVLAVLAALVWVSFKETRAIAAMQRCVYGGRVWFGFNPYNNPDNLPSWADGLVNRWVNNDNLHVCLRSLMTEPIHTIDIYERWIDDPGPVLRRFPKLNHLEAKPQSGTTSEEAWRKLCVGVRDCPVLTGLQLRGEHLTDAAVAPLAGHPTLREIRLEGGRITRASTATFASMPSLRVLYLLEQDWSASGLTDADLARMKEVLSRGGLTLYAVPPPPLP